VQVIRTFNQVVIGNPLLICLMFLVRHGDMVDMDDLVKASQCLLEVEDMQVLMNTSIWRAEHGSGQDMKRRGRRSY